MCGIAGITVFDEGASDRLKHLRAAVQSLRQRGPDDSGLFYHRQAALGHARLRVIDTSDRASQPMSAKNRRYTIVFNGEFYNYKEVRQELQRDHIRFVSESDTEVLLRLYIREGERCLKKVNGCFALAIYDKKEDTLFIARDRFGIKPLYYCRDGNAFLFASEMKAMMELGASKDIDKVSLFQYLQLTYIPAPHTIFRDVHKLKPGHCITVKGIHGSGPEISVKPYYEIPFSAESVIQPAPVSYRNAQRKLRELLRLAVERRMVSDVPLGAFLSGGVDSSVIASIAASIHPKLNTFSVGYASDPFFDESDYAEKVAKKIGSEHRVFKLTHADLFEQLHKALDYTDEPFADSSAIAVNALSERTRRHVTVALSGDGADELFGGYNKHFAEWKARNPGMAESLLKGGAPLLSKLPQSRDSKLGNLARQIRRFSEGLKLPQRERYWRWASFADQEEANHILREQLGYHKQRLSDAAFDYKKRKDAFLVKLRRGGDMNDVLLADMHLVLPNDMLFKVDLMSMAHGLEVRTPFLDHQLVNFAFTLPVGFKINGSMRKKILQDAFREELPEELYNRPKRGFEVPMLQWLKTDLKSMTDELLRDELLLDQGIFNPDGVKNTLIKLHSNNPGDAHILVWSLIVFQKWWLKYLPNLPD